jgi:hypothetical protein
MPPGYHDQSSLQGVISTKRSVILYSAAFLPHYNQEEFFL